MTTSSPITLSDVIAENTAYIRYYRKGESRTILPHSHGLEKQAFGVEIYKLYTSAFFLPGSPVGAYAKDYINREILMQFKEMMTEIEEYKRTMTRRETDKSPPDSKSILV